MNFYLKLSVFNFNTLLILEKLRFILGVIFLIINNYSFSSSYINLNNEWYLKENIQINGSITCLTFSPNENYIIAAALNTIYIYSLNGNLVKTLENAHDGNILDLKFNNTGHYLASSGSDKKIKIWDAYLNFNYKNTLQLTQQCPSIAFLPRTNVLACGCCNGSIKICNIFNGEILYTMLINRPINSIAFSPDRKSFTCAMNISSENTEKLNIWNLSLNQYPSKLLYGLEDWYVNSVNYSEFQDYMGCICSHDNEILPTIYPDASEILIYTLSQNYPQIQLYKKISEPQLCNSFDFTSESNLVAGYKNGHIKIWDFNNRVEKQTWYAHDDAITKIVYLPQSRIIVSASKDGCIKIWQQNAE